jgi:dUTP pyrophosphatase
MRIKVAAHAITPTRAHPTDGGLDLYTFCSVTVPPKGSAVIDTGVCVELPHNTCGLLVSKSGLNVKRDITSTGLIDEGYTGTINVKVYNHGYEPYTFKAGEKVSQLLVFPVLYPTLEIVDELSESPRGENGYGSTGQLKGGTIWEV